MQGKECSKCQEFKELEAYGVDLRGRQDRQAVCKACNNERAKRRRAATMPIDRICLQCYERKALDDFAISRTGKYGRRAVCKSCNAEYARRRRAGEPVKGGNPDESWERFRETWQPLSADVIAHWRAAFDRDMREAGR